MTTVHLRDLVLPCTRKKTAQIQHFRRARLQAHRFALPAALVQRLDNGNVDPGKRQLHRRHQSNGTRTDDNHLSIHKLASHT
jgi:hypothetical protein